MKNHTVGRQEEYVKAIQHLASCKILSLLGMFTCNIFNEI